jgi:arsenite-transporting ATPase
VRERESNALTALPAALRGLQLDLIALKPTNMVGLASLRSLLRSDDEVISPRPTDESPHGVTSRSLANLVEEIERDNHGLVMCMGKGGVGKTTVAAAIAVALAQRGHQVHLTTTDPAAHLAATLTATLDGLRVSRIDPEQATRDYRDHVMETKGKNLDESGRANLMEDLLSPCTEEVAVFQQFSRVLRDARTEFVIVDTAPTGHTLLLLDAAGSYHRDVVRQMGDSSNYRTPLMQLQDSSQTKVILVTLPEPTPVLEARTLQDDLVRAGIEPWAWVVNNSLTTTPTASPFLRQRAAAEFEQIALVDALSARVAVLPLLAVEPVGVARLTELATDNQLAATGS